MPTIGCLCWTVVVPVSPVARPAVVTATVFSRTSIEEVLATRCWAKRRGGTKGEQKQKQVYC